MMRLTQVPQETPGATLKVEGDIVSEWVPLLERECLSLLAQAGSVRLDLSGVTYVERKAAEMLERLSARQVTIVNGSPLIRELLREERSP